MNTCLLNLLMSEKNRRQYTDLKALKSVLLYVIGYVNLAHTKYPIPFHLNCLQLNSCIIVWFIIPYTTLKIIVTFSTILNDGAASLEWQLLIVLFLELGSYKTFYQTFGHDEDLSWDSDKIKSMWRARHFLTDIRGFLLQSDVCVSDNMITQHCHRHQNPETKKINCTENE